MAMHFCFTVTDEEGQDLLEAISEAAVIASPHPSFDDAQKAQCAAHAASLKALRQKILFRHVPDETSALVDGLRKLHEMPAVVRDKSVVIRCLPPLHQIQPEMTDDGLLGNLIPLIPIKRADGPMKSRVFHRMAGGIRTWAWEVRDAEGHLMRSDGAPTRALARTAAKKYIRAQQRARKSTEDSWPRDP